ncbi:MAG: hypothetical protein AB2L20_08835 [Mangrovibacterium sp.]
MNDILDNLRPYFDDNEEFDETKINELFSVFQRDFFEEPFVVNNLQVKVKRHPYNPRKDGLPEYFSHYYEKFVHITTRAIKDNKGNKCRKFCTERANRIHWIKPILITMIAGLPIFALLKAIVPYVIISGIREENLLLFWSRLSLTIS